MIENPCQLCGEESNRTITRTGINISRVLNLCEADYQSLMPIKTDIELKEFLIQSRKVTDTYVKAWGPWTTIQQWKKIKEEDKEFEFPTSAVNELEEFWDCFFARLTLLHIKGVDDYAILNAARSTLGKITVRSEKALQAQEGKKNQ